MIQQDIRKLEVIQAVSLSISLSPTRAGCSCFGKSWGPDDVECNGGLDPGYIHPVTKGNKRDACTLLQACSSRVAAERLESSRLIPASALRRDKQVPTLPFVLPTNTSTTVANQARTVGVSPQVMTPVPQHHHSGSYLSVPEDRLEGEPFSHFAFRMVLRSLLKGMFQGLVHIFDNHKLK